MAVMPMAGESGQGYDEESECRVACSSDAFVKENVSLAANEKPMLDRDHLCLFFSYFKDLVGREVTVELKNDLAIRGTLHSVDQYLNIKLENTRVVDEDKYPHMGLLAWPPSFLLSKKYFHYIFACRNAKRRYIEAPMIFARQRVLAAVNMGLLNHLQELGHLTVRARSVRNCFIRGSVVRYVQLPPEGVDIELLHDATRREARGG
ncbi:hypothetical protein ACFE04_031411 [Oxalis oulophora]